MTGFMVRPDTLSVCCKPSFRLSTYCFVADGDACPRTKIGVEGVCAGVGDDEKKEDETFLLQRNREVVAAAYRLSILKSKNLTNRLTNQFV